MIGNHTNEPIRHHYIPQFILRNFCFDSNSHLYYYDKLSKEMRIEDIRNVFMEKNLYRDETNNITNPTVIEKDFAKFESEVSPLISRFATEDSITVSASEIEKLKLFFALMGFRSERTAQLFSKDLKDSSKEFYSKYQQNCDFTAFWKRNLGHLANCRSLQDVLEHPNIDYPIKEFMMRDIFGFFGQYFVLLKADENFEFVMGDAYPTVVNGTLSNGVELPMYSIFPISPKRILLLVSNGVSEAPRNVLMLRPCIFQNPATVGDLIKIKHRKIYEEEITHINSMIIEEAMHGIVFKSLPYPYKK